MHSRQPDLKFTYSACGPFPKRKKKKSKKQEIYVYQNDLYKACFQHNMAYGFA